jgi:hypothetical protein
LSSIGGVFGSAASNDSARQLFVWGILYGVLSSVFLPVTTEVQQEAWQAAVEGGLHRALTPDELATMVVRGWMDASAAAAEALKSGVDGGDFANMTNNRRNPIPPEEAAVALRRQIIPLDAASDQPSFNNAVKQGNLGDQWGSIIQQLATQIPSPADILQANLEGQIPSGIDPRALYQAVGGALTSTELGVDWFDLMFNTRGSAPTPDEAATMANRGIIPWGTPDRGPVIQGPGTISFYQAFLEGPWRNKWVEAWEQLAEYLPPPRTVVAMLRSGALTVELATSLLEKEGLTPDLAAAYVADATHAKTAAHKTISESLTLEMFTDKLLTAAEATTALEELGYDATESALLLQTAQARKTLADLNKNISKIGNYYIAHKIESTTASAQLAALGVPADHIQELLTGWGIDRTADVKILTPAQIATAVDYAVITEDEGLAELERLGYTPYDAWILLSNRAKGPLPNKPPQGPPPLQ